MNILDQLEAAHQAPKNVIAGNLRCVTQAQLDFYFLAAKAMPDLIAVARVAKQLAEFATEVGWKDLDAALVPLTDTPEETPLDPRFPHHVAGCICPRFNDITPSLIADLTCPVHGVKGKSPGDLLAPEGEKP